MSEIDHGPLGERSEYPRHYDPSVLHPIPRHTGRALVGIDGAALPFEGVDIWNAYEMSWLDTKGKPVVGLLELRVPCDSPCIVESKSLKLYLGSFNNARYASREAIVAQIKQDLGAVTQAEVAVLLEPLYAGTLHERTLHERTLQEKNSRAGHFSVKTPPGQCIDDEELVNPTFEVDPSLLSIDAGADVEETLYSNLLRSNCPVTGQPDWATVIIHYRGQPILKKALLAYLVSYREHNDFHEQCVERIFLDILRHCQPRGLTVYARYTRRGGIDINPFRSNFERAAGNLRLIRQ